MKPARYILVPEAAKSARGALVLLDSDKLKHLRKVLRMEWDEFVYVTDGNGRLFEGWLRKQNDTGGVELGDQKRQEEPSLPLELVIGMPKNSTMDWVVEKAVECGVTLITPVVTARSVVRPSGAEKYVNRWQAIVDGAVEQSERLWRPSVVEPQPWAKWITNPSHSASFAFLSESRAEKKDCEAMAATCHALQDSAQRPVRVLIGPEGGFTAEEREALERQNFICLTLGSMVLRVETAAIAVLTLARAARLVSSCFVSKA